MRERQFIWSSVHRGVRSAVAWAAPAIGGLLIAPGIVAQAQPAAAEAHTEKASTEVFQEDVTSLNLSLGGSLNTGNTEAYQVDSGGDFALVRGHHGVGATARFSYGRANLRDDDVDEFLETVKNFRFKARYDFFFTPNDAIFLAAGYRWDEFAGLDARVQGQIGYLRNFLSEENHRLWGELGYDLTYDNWHQAEGAAPLPDDSQTVHSARAFIGYDNQLNESVTFLTGIEGLFNLEQNSDIRIGWDSALRSKIASDFQLELKFSLAWDGEPVPTNKELDTTTLVTIIYSMI